MKKHWDNPIEHSMPQGTPRARLPPHRQRHRRPGHRPRPHGRRHRHRLPPLHPQRQRLLASPDHLSIDEKITNQQSGCGLIMTEFTSADGLSRMRESKRKRYLTFYDDEHPISAQLFGSNPATLAEAARIVQDTGFDIVDLNLGCPAKRVVSCNGG